MNYLENDFLKVAVSDHGAELSGILDKKSGCELVWNADPAYWNRHAPVLFPFVGKVNGGTYLYEGSRYPMGQHGFARDREFTLVENTGSQMTHRLVSDEESKKVYPFDFIFEVTHVLNGKKLSILWTVKNPSTEKILYFSVGGHPAFNCPILPGTSKEEYSLRFEHQSELRYVLIDPTDSAVDFQHPNILPLENGVLKIRESFFDNDAMIFDAGQIQKVSILTPAGTPYITMTCPGFPSFGIWSKPKANAPYICLEPWIGRCDNKGFSGELKDKFGEQALAAGKSFSAKYAIEVGDIV